MLREKLSEEELKEVGKKTISVSALKPQSPKETTAERDGDIDRSMRGNTTFAELRDWKLTDEEIEQVLGISIGKPGVAVRNHCAANMIEFGEVKTGLQALVDAKNQ